MLREKIGQDIVYIQQNCCMKWENTQVKLFKIIYRTKPSFFYIQTKRVLCTVHKGYVYI